MVGREKIGEVEVAFDDFGQGPALVLLHPFPFHRRIWGENASSLAEADCRVIAVDFPGFGDSPVPPRRLSIAAMADVTAGLLDRLAIETACLVGVSMGGYVALAFADKFPRRLHALVLADTRATADSPTAREGRAAALAILSDTGPQGGGGIDQYLAQSVPKLLAPDAPTGTLTRALALAERRPETVAAALEAMRDREDRTAVLAGIDCPTLVLVGEADTVTPAAEMENMVAAIPGASFLVIPDAGHLSNLEAPLEFNLAVLDFLRGVPTLATAVEAD